LSTSTLGGTAAADSLASWQQMTGASLGTRWILAPLTDSIAALQLADSGGTLTLSRGWSARLTSPETPIVVNGVVFVLEPGRGDTAATLHAYEGASGKELWTSGKTMTSPAAPASFWSSSGQIYVGTMDGTVYAFGFNDERR
jgi:glucose dehydrogenase